MPKDSDVLDVHFDTLVSILDLIRSSPTRTRPEIGHELDLGRTIVNQRIAQLLESGLVREGSMAASTGGRPARALEFHAAAGNVLMADLGATSIAVGIANLRGEILASLEEPADIADGPDVVLTRVEEIFTEALARRPADAPPIWGIGVGLPGPVEFAAGRPVAPPIMPGWDRFPVRERLARKYGVPTWVDNDVNLMALGELRAGLARGASDVIFVKVGTGIGAGLISGGRLHRGAQGVAGDIGHVAVTDDPSVVCRCGNLGCLEAVAGGAALSSAALAAARDSRSPFLENRLRTQGQGDAKDVADAASHGDPLAVGLLTGAGEYLGSTLAMLVNFYNPELVIVGGGVASSGDLFLAAVREAMYRRSLPAATRDLRIESSRLSDEVGLHGAAFLVIDELFSRRRLPLWIGSGSPVGRPEIAGTDAA